MRIARGTLSRLGGLRACSHRFFCKYVGLHTGTRVPIGTDIHFEKNRYLPVSLRTGTKRHRFVFEYRFVSTA